MKWTANWIWSPGEISPRNAYFMFRKAFKANAADDARVHVSADTRYVLFINGRRLGQGPVRSHPWKQRYDTYDIAEFLVKGENQIAVLVQHEGTSNFQYICRQGGLLAQVEEKGKAICGTDVTWLTKRAKAWADNTPQISVQQGHTEHYDARLADEGWTLIGFKDSKWKPAVAVCKASEESTHALPWSGLTPREIPFLTEEEVFPVRVHEPCIVSVPKVNWSFEMKPYADPGDLGSNPIPYRGILVGIVNLAKATKASVVCNGVNQSPRSLWINGKEIPAIDDQTPYADVQLKAGDNVFAYKCSGNQHQAKIAIAIHVRHAKEKITAKDGWTYIATDPELISKIKTAKDIANVPGERRPLLARDAEQVFVAKDFSHGIQHVIGAGHESEFGPQPRIDNLHALATPGPDYATIHPSAKSQGDDGVQLKLDFGKEISGFWQIELEAPAGTIIDLNGYEGHLADGQVQSPSELDNSLRYTCKEGWQTFRSFFRHGQRHLHLAVRNASGLVKIRKVSTVFSSYPHPCRGEFKCSDPLLDRIWEMGALTLRNCSEDTFVDCPMVEQTYWVGDARNEALVHNVVVGDPRLPERCWHIAAESLDTPTGKLKLTNCQCPSGWELVLTAWTLFWMIGCEEHYQITGSKAFVESIYPAVKRCADELLTSVNKSGLIEYDAWNLLDWAPMDYQPVSIHNSAWTVRALKSTAGLARILGRETESSQYLASAQGIRDAINEHAWSESEQAYIDSIHPDGKPSPVVSQQTNTVVLLCDCATPERRKQIQKVVLNPPAHFVKSGSPFMDFFVAEAFARQGDFKEILNLFRKKWGLMVRYDATTCWETYPGPGPYPGDVANFLTRSHCHAWSAAPTYFLSLCQLGVSPLEPGYTKVRIAPEPAGLAWARGRVPILDRGEISVDWRSGDGHFHMTAHVPARLSVQIKLPSHLREAKSVRIHTTYGFTWIGAGNQGPIDIPAPDQGFPAQDQGQTIWVHTQ